MNQWINISEVLAEIEKVAENGELFTFSIAWVRANNSQNGPKGSIKRVLNARKGTRTQKKTGKTTGKGQTSKKWQFKSYGGIPIVDVDQDKMLVPKFSHIIEFNGMKVRHYGS